MTHKRTQTGNRCTLRWVGDSPIGMTATVAHAQVTKELALRGTFLYTLDPNILDPPPSKLPAVFVLKDGEQHRYNGALAGHTLYKWVLMER